MAENGNRGPNDAFRRTGRRRREPPIIDAAASELPRDEAANAGPDATPESGPAVAEPATPAGPVMTDAGSAIPNDGAPDAVAPGTGPADAERRDEPRADGASADAAPASAERDEPVLFGSALRDPPRGGASAAALPPSAPEDTATRDEEIAAATTATAAEPQPESGPTPSAIGGIDPPRRDDPPSLPPQVRSGSSPLAGILGVAAVVLLGIIGWLLYTGGQRGGDAAAAVADLKTRVAALESRPDPAALQAQVAALEKRVAAADGDRTSLGRTVAALEKRVDGLGGSGPAAAPSGAAPQGGAASGDDAAKAAAAGAAGLAALAAKVDALEGRVSALAADASGTAKTVAALPKPVAPDFGPVEARIAALATAVNAADSKINASDARFNGFDAKVNATDAKVNDVAAKLNAVTDRINGLDGRLDDATAATAKLKAEVANLPKVDLQPLQASVAALDGRVAKVEAALAAPKDGARVTEARAVGSADEARATPVAVVAQALERAIAAGTPYEPELDALKALGADPALVARLAPDAKSGAPSVEALAGQWDEVRGAVLATVEPVVPAAGGTLNRLLSSATSIVRVRRVGAVEGEDTNAIVSRIDAALGQGDVAGALAAWDKLPEAGKAASQAWADAARNRMAAAAAAGDLVRNAIATLARRPS